MLTLTATYLRLPHDTVRIKPSNLNICVYHHAKQKWSANTSDLVKIGNFIYELTQQNFYPGRKTCIEICLLFARNLLTVTDKPISAQLRNSIIFLLSPFKSIKTEIAIPIVLTVNKVKTLHYV